MFKIAKIKIGVKGNGNYKTIFNSYKPKLSYAVAHLCNKEHTGKVSNFDADYTYLEEKCLHSYVLVEDIPMLLEICKECDENFYKITLK